MLNNEVKTSTFDVQNSLFDIITPYLLLNLMTLPSR